VWTVRARTLDLRLVDHIRFTQLSLVERYNQPDTAVLQGTLPDLAPLLAPGMGAVLYDGPTQRTSGVVTDLERHGDGTAQVTLAGDLIRLWDRICFPDPANQFYAQTRDHDVRTGPAGRSPGCACPATRPAAQPPRCPRAWMSSVR
jgi:hypothetical protein